MALRTKEYEFTISQRMREDSSHVINFVETSMKESELNLFEALSAAIGCYGEPELARKNGVAESVVSETKDFLRKKGPEDTEKMGAAIKVLSWFGLSIDQHEFVKSLRGEASVNL